MQQLLEDPETLPFKQGKAINLSILRKEINRRVIKIKHMLGYNQHDKKIKVTNYGCQTQNIQLNGQTIQLIQQSQVLSPKKSTQNLPVESNKKSRRYAGRCSLPVRKLNDKKVDQNGLRKSTRVRVSQYLLIAKANEESNIKQNIQRITSQKNLNEAVQDDQVVSINQLDFFNSFKNSKKKSELYIQRSGYNQMTLPLVFGNCQFDSEDQDLHYVKSNSLINKTMSVKKIRFTERTALEQQKRYSITEDIMQKMNSEISKQILKKRREAQDNKLRENIFKKIEEKYGEYFDNI